MVTVVGLRFAVAHARLFAGVAAVVVVLVVIAVGLRIYPLSAGESADGRIAFFSHRDGDAEIYVMNADGSDVVQLTYNEYSDYGPAWSPLLE